MVTHCLQQPRAYNHWSIDSVIFGLLNGSVIKPSWFIAIYINVHVPVNEENVKSFLKFGLWMKQWWAQKVSIKGEKKIVTAAKWKKSSKSIKQIMDHYCGWPFLSFVHKTGVTCHWQYNYIYLNQMTNHLGNHNAL